MALPNLGLETVHHVHADDVAQAFVRAIHHWRAGGRRELPRRVAAGADPARLRRGDVAWFGQAAALRFLPWEQWRTAVSPEEAEATWDHIAHSPNCSIAKAQRLLGYQPRYTSLRGVQEAVTWLIEQGIVQYRSGAGPLAKP